MERDLLSRVITVALTLLVAGTLAAACGDDGSTTSGGGSDGVAVAEASGCVACHGDRGQGGVGPAWQGLAGSTVELDDGTEVVADREYIRRSITDPDADIVAGYNVRMPEVDLSDREIDALVAYIESLG